MRNLPSHLTRSRALPAVLLALVAALASGIAATGAPATGPIPASRRTGQIPTGALKSNQPVPETVRQAFKKMYPSITVERIDLPGLASSGEPVYQIYYHIEGWENKTVFKDVRWVKTFKYITPAEFTPAAARTIAERHAGRRVDVAALLSTPAGGIVYYVRFPDLELYLDLDGMTIEESAWPSPAPTAAK